MNSSTDTSAGADVGSEATQTRVFNSQLESESESDNNTSSSELFDNLVANIKPNNLQCDSPNLSPPKSKSKTTHKRTPSSSHRRRQRPVQPMESISETGFGLDTDNFESVSVSSRHNSFMQNADTVTSASTSSSSSYSSPRRRRSNPASSSSGSSGALRRRQNLTIQAAGSDENVHGTRRRTDNSSGLAASLDSGMKSLRKWIRSRKFAVSEAAPSAESNSDQITMRLGDDDISALSRAGNDSVPVTAARSATSGDSSSNISESDGSSGFLYYRPYEVNIRHGFDDNIVYGSDDGSSELFPLVNLSHEGGLRNRAHSEPDRARVANYFFGSVYSSRAVDRGGARNENPATGRRNTVDQVNVTDEYSPAMIEEGNAISILELPTPPTPNEQSSHSTTDLDDNIVTDSTLVGSPDGLETATPPEPADNDNINSSNSNDNNNVATETIIDPDRDARTRWLQINRRFRCIISSVALAFSFFLVLFLISWVILIATYIISLGKTCDVPLKAYFWLATLQLALDFFRAEIMKIMCRWRSDSRGGVPLRVLLYNVAYLVYAALVLRLGIVSVFVRESTCYNTAPELFLASAVFMCISLLAWMLIIVGYIIPYATVAVLLTRNGYFPNADFDDLNGIEGNRRGRLIGILPNNLSNPAPPECVEKLRVIMYDEINDSSQKECCICLQDYAPGEGIVATPCEHVFHKQCCKEWLNLSRSCPICRRDIVEALGEESTLEEGSLSDRGGHRPRGWQRDASNLLQFLRRDQREPRVPAEDSNATS
ncbi:hypothetical protein ACHAWC_006107 [Mediolabrus comicus]